LPDHSGSGINSLQQGIWLLIKQHCLIIQDRE
jgi:hypothetical protein